MIKILAFMKQFYQNIASRKLLIPSILLLLSIILMPSCYCQSNEDIYYIVIEHDASTFVLSKETQSTIKIVLVFAILTLMIIAYKHVLKYSFIFLICIILFTIGVYISKYLIQTFSYTQLDVINDLYALTKTDRYKNDIIYKVKIDMLIKIFINDINLKDQNLDSIEDVLFFSIVFVSCIIKIIQILYQGWW